MSVITSTVSSRLSLLSEEFPSECLSTSYCPGLLHSNHLQIAAVLVSWYTTLYSHLCHKKAWHTNFATKVTP